MGFYRKDSGGHCRRQAGEWYDQGCVWIEDSGSRIGLVKAQARRPTLTAIIQVGEKGLMKGPAIALRTNGQVCMISWKWEGKWLLGDAIPWKGE